MASRLVLVVETDPVAQRHVADLLTNLGYEPMIAESVEEALAALSRNEFVLSLVDLNSAEADGIDLLRRLKVQGGTPGSIIIIANGSSIKRIPEAAALGADDVLQKPFTPEDLENTIKSAIARPMRAWGREAHDDRGHRLQDELALWQSPQMHEVREIIRQAARADVTVLICGETGTGKDLVARAIHEFGVRRTGPFVKVNCAAVPRDLLESELFGHERGAFTGADRLQRGRFELAEGGTLFLDEIGELAPVVQAKLLRVLQERQYERVGGTALLDADVRLITATNRDLEQAVAEGRFREDLYYRLAVFRVHLPPLRERGNDVVLLGQHFVRELGARAGKGELGLSGAAREVLLTHRWRGNIRELQNAVERALIVSDGGLITAEQLGITVTRAAVAEAPARVGGADSGVAAAPRPVVESLADLERRTIIDALARVNGNKSRAAAALGVSRTQLYTRLKRFGLAD